MKVIIAGGRNYKFTREDISALNELKFLITEVVSGKARGADTEGEYWARSIGIPIAEFPAEWDTNGSNAGFLRNKQMAEYADGLIAFAGGSGTDDMIKQARKKGLSIWDWRDLGQNEIFG